MSVFDSVYCMLQNLVEWIQDKEEVEIVDLILRIKEKLVSDTANILWLYTASIQSGTEGNVHFTVK